MNTQTTTTKRAPREAKAPPATAFINARIIDPASNRDEPGGLVVREGLIADIGPHLRRNAPDGIAVIDCKGHVLAPGLIDAQVFTGEPGFEHRETLKTASHAAAAGGVTTMVVMPETDPVIDQVALVDFIQRRARDNAIVHVHTMAAMTKGLKGEEMTEIGLLQRAGAVAFSNGKTSVANTRVMRNVLLYAKDFGALIVHHTEDPYLASSGSMNSGEVAARLGLPGVPKASETIMLERDVRLVEMTRGRYHAATISCAESLEVIRSAKARKLPVTCGVSINHLTLNENDIGPYRTFYKMRPPLRSDDDRAAMIRGLAAGDIDIIVSSHDPQDADDKRRPFAEATDGAVGLETLLAAALRLHHSGELPLLSILRAMTINPAKLLGLHSGKLTKGAIADIVVFDPGEPWVVNKDALRSRSKNTPFDESKMQGRVLRTLVAGETVYQHPGAERS
jgi:dihydroorotase